MSTSKDTVTYLLGQLEPLDVRARPMFGEYGLYCDDKVVAFVCDDALFVKPTEAADEYSDPDWLAPAYPGSKDYHRVPQERLEDVEWLQEFVQRTADVLPVPKKKPTKKKPPKQK
ncbi:TfoX/Sxy family protein [Antrihabitans cavernicola]|uniref:TfoX/Sxy family protein n=1 Tax=Antrihabitans cavernicola TaxID=2495913 RepID=A0A5A7SFX0_9NOCA|nr:TfoX/Sxy family protein [Spelaeibacter cavernicola]KAA0023151.1 TfoX/Sxy family protein [Spelaeibacter cavernicola]